MTSSRNMTKIFSLLFILPFMAGSNVEILSPQSFGALGNGIHDDSAALKRTFAAATDTRGLVILGGTYLVSRQLVIDGPISIEGGGTILAAPGIENSIGVRGTDSLLHFTALAAGSSIDGLSFDLAGQGRTALRIEAPDMSITNVTIKNYSKSVKADNRQHSKSESGIRISASNITLSQIKCHNMITLVRDAVPRCITIHGGADNLRLSAISGSNINGGVTVGAAMNVHVTDYDFRNLTDNGFYLLPNSSQFVAENGYMSNVNEAIVFKGNDATIRNLRIHNQEQGIGLENASGVTLVDITVTHDELLTTRPSFMRTRRGNKHSDNIVLEDILADIPLGGSVFNLAVGSVSDMFVSNATFHLVAGSGFKGAAYLLRQNSGVPPTITDTTFEFKGVHKELVKSAILKAPDLTAAYMLQFESSNDVRRDGASVPLRQKPPKNRRPVQ